MDHRLRSPQELTAFGRWLMARLAERRMTRADLARACRVYSGNVSRWLYRANPETEMCRRIAGALMLPLDEVLVAAGHVPAGSAGRPAGEIRREAAAILERIPEALLVPLLPMLRGLAGEQAATRARLDALLAPAPEPTPERAAEPEPAAATASLPTSPTSDHD